MTVTLKAGKVRSIGVSNFLQEDVANIVNNGTIKPAVNQIEVHIGHVPTDLMKYCENLGIQSKHIHHLLTDVYLRIVRSMNMLKNMA